MTTDVNGREIKVGDVVDLQMKVTDLFQTAIRMEVIGDPDRPLPRTTLVIESKLVRNTVHHPDGQKPSGGDGSQR